MAAANAAISAANIAGIHTVLSVCGLTNAGDRDLIRNGEGLASIADFGVFDNDRDVADMAKRLSSRTINDGRVNLGTVHIKKIQALVWWINDRQKFGQDLDPDEFDQAAMLTAMESKRIEKDQFSSDVATITLAKFDPDDFETHEDSFMNMLSQALGISKKCPLRYVVRSAKVPVVFVDNFEERIFQMPIVGPDFDSDNRTVYRKLKAFLVSTAGYAWIERFDKTENGRQAFKAWVDHYNGTGELSKRTALAKSKLENLHYKNERSMSFERYTELLTKSFSTLDKDIDEKLSDTQKVNALLKGIKTQDMELSASKAVISQQYPRNLAAACAYFSKEVARLHGGAQLENQRNHRKRRISGVGRDGGRGRGRGRGRNSSRGRGRGRRGGRHQDGRGRGYQGTQTEINGINVVDPTRSFTDDEWTRLGPNGGRAYVTQERLHINGRGRGADGRGGGRGGSDRKVSAADVDQNTTQNTGTDGQDNQTQNQDAGRGGDRGGRNGVRFGRSAYNHY